MINNRYLNKIKSPVCLNGLVILFLLFLNGCSDKVNLAKLCDTHADICSEFEEDTWCKSERVDVVLNKIRVNDNNLDKDKYKLLIGYEGYIKCMSLASQIQHIKLKEKTILRKQNLLKAKVNLSLLSEEITNSDHPHLLYYKWSRQSDELALIQFLKLEGTPILENSTDQYHLATYYIKRETKKTIGLLYRALELHEPGTEIHPEILQSLATIFTKKKQYKQTYIWLRTYQLLLDKPDKVLEISLNNFQKEKVLDAGFLDDVANATLTKIKEGKFTSPSY